MTSELNKSVGKSLLEYFASRQGDVLALIRALVEAESPSGDAEGSRAVVGLLEGVAQSLKSVNSIERIPARENFGEHLRIRAFGNAANWGEPTLLLLGHTDTVHARGSITERPLREENGRIYGPGIFDMKGGCALALETMRACETLALAPARQVVLLLTCDEEVGSATGRALVEEEAGRAHSVLVLEPPASGGRVKTARKGTAGYALTLEGVAAHAGLEPEKGASAILELARHVEYLHSLNDLTRGTTLNVGVISGGTRSNVVAAEARADVDVRFQTHDEAKRIEQVFQKLKSFDERVRIKVEGEINRPPLERTEAVARLYERARAIASTLDFELGETSVGGASDGNFAALRCASILDGLGIDGDGAHAAHEHIIAENIPQRGALIAGLIASL